VKKCDQNICIGDLVNFYSGFGPFNDGYESRNPGLVLGLKRRGGWSGDSMAYTVLWSDETITAEHQGYLIRVDERDLGEKIES